MNTAATRRKRRIDKAGSPPRAYAKFAELDGRHDFRQAVPGGFVDYQVRLRRGGRVVYFDFALAKEMGLLPKRHPHRLNLELARVLLDTFGIQIINEYDVLYPPAISPEEMKRHAYMATRYLQLQHPDRRGRTSGDGRSIWNGQVRSRGTTWDVTSCGTGATRLSPATAIEKRFFRTGDPCVSYGCGQAVLGDGLGTALMSAIFNRNGIRTERTLAIIEYPGSTAIVVRAGKNLLRPSHFFHHLKQGNLTGLRSAIDYFLDRQVANGEWNPPARGAARYRYLADEVAGMFARLSARFECEYIFCWLDWDGDNILADGGIVDYGSVRQFGLYHHEYRYDDVDRMSTTIDEQCEKARYLVQVFAQIRDYLITGKKQSLRSYRSDSALRLYDRELDRYRLLYTLFRLGFTAREQQRLLAGHEKLVREFRKHYRFFECAVSARAAHASDDGITRDAIFCVRDILRELPFFHLEYGRWMTAEEFLNTIRSRYARGRDLELTPRKRWHMQKFQLAYAKLLQASVGASAGKGGSTRLIRKIARRSAIINRADRITGNAIVHVARELTGELKKRTFNELSALVEKFIDYQEIAPDHPLTARARMSAAMKPGRGALRTLADIVHEDREGL